MSSVGPWMSPAIGALGRTEVMDALRPEWSSVKDIGNRIGWSIGDSAIRKHLRELIDHGFAEESERWPDSRRVYYRIAR